MLILSRRIGESVVIGDETYCTVLGFRGRQIVLGFDAPESVIIHRNEIYQKIKSEKGEGVIWAGKKYCPAFQGSDTMGRSVTCQ